ncbi:polyprenyl synthetase family protein [Streptomyces sp. NPDC059564]|uniref:polyprenyl synthetase family protein n=1 Tax=Streptomyces sp. NPDC059564 TaxID=3346865 RepID=UPI0036912860
MDVLTVAPAARLSCLTEAQDLVGPALRSAVDRLPGPVRHIAGYHLGWWDEHGRPVDGDGGKAIRAALVLLAARAVGGSVTAAVPAAVAVELVHNFSLLHDDVMDGDRTRRGRTAAWAAFGSAEAILTGDAMLSLAFSVLSEADAQATSGGAECPERGLPVLLAAVFELVEGQAQDLAFEKRDDVTLRECLAMASGKTASLLACACGLGALFGGGERSRIELLKRFGRDLGLAFQLVDDLLGIWGDPQLTGKPAGSDLLHHKKSLPVVAALMHESAAAEELARLYLHRGTLENDQVARAAELVEEAGGRRWAVRETEMRLEAAASHLRAIQPDPEAAEQLLRLTQLVAQRDK